MLNSKDYKSRQCRKRAFIICAKDAAVLAAFVWPPASRDAPGTAYDEMMLPVGTAPEALYKIGAKVRAALEDPASGLAPPDDDAVYSRPASVYRRKVSKPLKVDRTPVITASRGSALYVWERTRLRTFAGVEALRFMSFADDEVAAMGAAADELGISSSRLCEYAGDAFVVVLVAKLMRALVDAFATVASAEEAALWLAEEAEEDK